MNVFFINCAQQYQRARSITWHVLLRCKRVNHALPGTWHLEDLEHFLFTSTAITTVRTSSNSPVNNENAIVVGGPVVGRKYEYNNSNCQSCCTAYSVQLRTSSR